MSRWHRKSCKTPAVVQLDGSLICKECFETAPTEEESCKTASVSAPPYRPEKPGAQLNISWPSSVKYLQVDESGGQVSAAQSKPSSPTSQQRPSVPDTTSSTQSILHSHALTESDKIRLLTIFPGPDSSPLHGSLRSVGLMSRPDYDALSYTWADESGDNTLCRRVYIGPFWDILPITSNCERALKCLRDPTDPRDVWVDSICIDQDNNRERSHQVGMMGRIYSFASRVVAYLGPGSETGNRAMGIIHGGKAVFSSSETESLRSLFSRPYFSRLWIVQEISLANSLVFRCGEASVSHNAYHKALSNLFRKGILPRWMEQTMSSTLDPQTLVSVVTELGSSQCSDPRDHVFGLLGLFRSALQEGLIPDYSLSQMEVFTGFAAYAIQKSDPYTVLEYAIRSDDTATTLPSWVPNWGGSYLPIRSKPSRFRIGNYDSIPMRSGSTWISRLVPQLALETAEENNTFLTPSSDGTLKVVGDCLVININNTFINNSSAPIRSIILEAGACTSCRTTVEFQLKPGKVLPSLSRSKVTIFRTYGYDRLLLFRESPGSTHLELLGIGDIEFQVGPAVMLAKLYYKSISQPVSDNSRFGGSFGINDNIFSDVLIPSLWNTSMLSSETPRMREWRTAVSTTDIYAPPDITEDNLGLVAALDPWLRFWSDQTLWDMLKWWKRGLPRSNSTVVQTLWTQFRDLEESASTILDHNQFFLFALQYLVKFASIPSLDNPAVPLSTPAFLSLLLLSRADILSDKIADSVLGTFGGIRPEDPEELSVLSQQYLEWERWGRVLEDWATVTRDLLRLVSRFSRFDRSKSNEFGRDLLEEAERVGTETYGHIVKLATRQGGWGSCEKRTLIELLTRKTKQGQMVSFAPSSLRDDTTLIILAVFKRWDWDAMKKDCQTQCTIEDLWDRFQDIMTECGGFQNLAELHGSNFEVFEAICAMGALQRQLGFTVIKNKTIIIN